MRHRRHAPKRMANTAKASGKIYTLCVHNSSESFDPIESITQQNFPEFFERFFSLLMKVSPPIYANDESAAMLS